MALPRPTLLNGIIIVAVAYGLAYVFKPKSDFDAEIASRPKITEAEAKAQFDSYMKRTKSAEAARLGKQGAIDAGLIAAPGAARPVARPENAPVLVSPPAVNSAPPTATSSEAAATVTPAPSTVTPPPSVPTPSPAAAPVSAPIVSPAGVPSRPSTAAAAGAPTSPPGRATAAAVVGVSPTTAPTTVPVAGTPPPPAAKVKQEVVRDTGPSLKDRLMRKSFTVGK